MNGDSWISLSVTFDDTEEALRVCGNRDQNVRLIRDAFGKSIQVFARGMNLQIDGPRDTVNVVEKVVQNLRQLVRQRVEITEEEVRRVLAHNTRTTEKVTSQTTVAAVPGSRHLRPRTDGQAKYVQSMVDFDVVFAVGPAGTGKTYLAVGMAVNLLRQGAVKKIVLCRPAVEAGEKLGFLPGDIAAKVNPYLRPLLDGLNDMMEPEQVRRYLDNDIIEIAPLAFMRGRTLNQAVIILDEGQNTTVPQMQMFLTRMGHGSKIIVTGDITQIDLPASTRSGLIDATQRLKNVEGIGMVILGEQDIVRHPLVQRIVKAYEDDGRPKTPGEEANA